MANDDFDNRRTDNEMMAALIAKAEAEHPGAHIDIRTWPGRAEIYLNRPAVVDLITKLQTVLALSLPTVNVCVTLIDIGGQTMVEISTDDSAPAS